MTDPHEASARSEILTIVIRALAREAARQHPIQIVTAASGGFDVHLRLDGTYRSREDATAAARFLSDALLDAARLPAILASADVDAPPGSGVPDLLGAMYSQRVDGGDQ
ncbi:hypothetical protein [Gordonia sp. N1V]|uniref:hypothetical protein n=1 Tax=Gordonia sp. N1V TaxID=3034163 RepID=UPI0023E161B3|nr:hypothetical protein [Gordonia sp. N1V]MDF3283372.1 hypothetical protein [Gordonia sp. N1V]